MNTNWNSLVEIKSEWKVLNQEQSAVLLRAIEFYFFSHFATKDLFYLGNGDKS